MEKRYTGWRRKNKDWYSKQMEIKGKHKHRHSHLVNQKKGDERAHCVWVKGTAYQEEINCEQNIVVPVQVWVLYVQQRHKVLNAWSSVGSTVWGGNGTFKRWNPAGASMVLIWGCITLPHFLFSLSFSLPPLLLPICRWNMITWILGPSTIPSSPLAL